MITGGSTLDPGFPTWGTMLREHGYHTRWYGKWHLTHHDGNWSRGTRRAGARALRLRRRHVPFAQRRARPGLAPGRPHRARSSPKWFEHERRRRAVVHDRLVREPARHRLVVRVERPRRAPRRARGARSPRLPPNFETPELLIERGKPRLQRSLQETAAASFGPGALRRPRSGRAVERIPRPLRQAPARGRPPHRPRARHAPQPPRGRRRTPSSCSPPTTASTAARTACAARAPAPTRRRSACR